jgi:flavorubredoxin
MRSAGSYRTNSGDSSRMNFKFKILKIRLGWKMALKHMKTPIPREVLHWIDGLFKFVSTVFSLVTCQFFICFFRDLQNNKGLRSVLTRSYFDA